MYNKEDLTMLYVQPRRPVLCLHTTWTKTLLCYTYNQEEDFTLLYVQPGRLYYALERKDLGRCGIQRFMRSVLFMEPA